MTDTTLPATWGDALFIGNFANGSPEWHEARKLGFGGSDISTICGVNPWDSPFSLWAKKTGKLEDDFEGNDATEWGTRLEPVIMDKFFDNHPELWIYRSPGTFRHKDREWQIANPDGIYKNEAGEFGIIEIKTAAYEDDWKQVVNGKTEYVVPQYYKTQVQWYMQTFGFKHAWVVVLFSGKNYQEIELHADEFEQAVNLERVTQFKEYVDQGLQPDYDGAMSTYQTIRRLHPLIDDTEVELGELGTMLQIAAHEFTMAEAHINEMKSRVLDLMGRAKKGTVGGKPVVGRQAKAGGTPYLVIKK
jgi:putative phage-type endonuclease